MPTGRPWLREELLDVLRLYCLTPFGRLHSRNPEVVSLAGKLGRTAASVAYKLVNFASLDPTIDRKGMSNTSALDRTVWAEFSRDPGVIAERLEGTAALAFQEAPQAEYSFEGREGRDTVGMSKRRVNQSFFRSMILASYESKCAMTGVSDQRLLVASHIDPWAQNTARRLDPHNGLCLNYLHDRAFENGLIAVAPDLSILYSSRLPSADLTKLRSISQPKLMLPSRFKPDMVLLERHRTSRFEA